MFIDNIERHQAIDLLTRAANRLMEQVDFRDQSSAGAADLLFAMVRELNNPKLYQSELANQTLTFEQVMSLLSRAEEKRGRVTEWMARYLSNFDVSEDSLLLAAGYALPDRYKLAYEDAESGEINWKEQS